MGKIEKVTDRIIRSLWRDGKPDKAVLSNVRGAATLLSRQAQSVWPVMMANLDEKMLSRDGRPTYAETAVYAAIRFFMRFINKDKHNLFTVQFTGMMRIKE